MSKQATPKKRPQRTCVACRRKVDKRELTRLVLADGLLMTDPTGKMDGRGAYVCTQASCWQRVAQTPILDRALRTKLNDEQRRGLVSRLADDRLESS